MYGFKLNLKIVFIVCCGCILTGCPTGLKQGYVFKPKLLPVFPVVTPDIDLPHDKHPGRNGELTPQEMKIARIAWQYFENNYHPNTGMVNAAQSYPALTFWDIGSYFAAMVAAYELKIIDKNKFDKRMSKILETLNGLSFFQDMLPNKVYNAKTKEKVSYANKPAEIGSSAIDLGRVLIWFKIIKERYPQYSDRIDQFVLRWDFSKLISADGTLFGFTDDFGESETTMQQEGRLGYEEYAAKGYALWGFDTSNASKAEPYRIISMYGVDIPYDARDPLIYHAHNYVVTESYVLEAFEFNWDMANDSTSDDLQHSHPWVSRFAQNIYLVQERRYKNTGILTARTEHQLDKSPYFVYDTIFSDGVPWNTLTEDGQLVPDLSAVSAKGAIGLWALWNTDYTDLLFDKVTKFYAPYKGFNEGIYEKSGKPINAFTCNNNAVILEALLHKVQGKILRFSGRESLWDRVVREKYK